jgi:hypothetical protein
LKRIADALAAQGLEPDRISIDVPAERKSDPATGDTQAPTPAPAGTPQVEFAFSANAE